MNKKELAKELDELKQVDKLHEHVINDIVEDATTNYTNYDNFVDQVKARVEDVQHGCSSGTVGSLIYYTDTLAFYEKYKTEINSLLYEMIQDTGMQPSELFGKNFDKEDPLCIDQGNQNLLAWFGYEEVNNKIASILEL